MAGPSCSGSKTSSTRSMRVCSEPVRWRVRQRDSGFLAQGDRVLYAALVRGGPAFYNDLYSIGVDGSDARLLVVGAMEGQWLPR